MKKILEDLYYGEINPHMQKFTDDPRFKEAMQIADEREEMLIKALCGEERSCLIDLINAYDQITGIATAESFISGFKLGAGILAESLL